MTHIRPIVEKLNQTRAALLEVTTCVPGERWRERPAPEKWSAAEVIAHLTQVEATILDGATKVFAREPRPVPLWKRLHISPRFAEWRGLRARTPIPLDPTLLAAKDVMLGRFQGGRERLLAFLESHRDRDLSRWRWPHPFFGSLNGYQWFRLIYHHEIRHTQQLREIVKSFGTV